MTAATLAAQASSPTIPAWTGDAKHARHLLRRTALMYLALAGIGLVVAVAVKSAAWRTAGLGAALPGGGFLAVGGWWTLGFVVSLVLLLLACIAWFGSGMVVAPMGVWLTAAAVAVAVAPDETTSWGPPAGAVLLVVGAVVSGLVLRRNAAAGLRRREQRNADLLREMPRVTAVRRAALTVAPSREMNAEQLAGVRYCLDLALQDNNDWDGFNCIDQFQTSAVRYQINQLGWTLAAAQSLYTPSFTGAVSAGQRNLIERYLQPKTVGYWRWERLWGHLRWESDPVGRDNIMLTGYFGLNVALYSGTTGDDRYLQPGSLTFKVTPRRTYAHSGMDIRDSLLENYAHYGEGFCLYPCEPNWVYSACNMRGAATLAAYDRLLGTDHWPTLSARFREQLEREFMTRDGNVIALRSQLTGLPVPFPMPVSVLAKELNPTLPDLAHRYWALVRSESLRWLEDEVHIDLPGKNVDFGNYTVSDAFALGGIYGSAREMGDVEVAEAALARIEAVEQRHSDGSVYEGRSTLFNATLALDRLLPVDGWRTMITKPVGEAVRRGPVLSSVPYPQLLVTSAQSDGDSLSAVLVPGLEAGRHTVTIERLRPGRHSVRAGRERSTVEVGTDGRLNLPIEVHDRTELAISPAS
jgi:hypothetical protein